MRDRDLILVLKRNPQVFQQKNSLDKVLETKHFSEPILYAIFCGTLQNTTKHMHHSPEGCERHSWRLSISLHAEKVA